MQWFAMLRNAMSHQAVSMQFIHGCAAMYHSCLHHAVLCLAACERALPSTTACDMQCFAMLRNAVHHHLLLCEMAMDFLQYLILCCAVLCHCLPCTYSQSSCCALL